MFPLPERWRSFPANGWVQRTGGGLKLAMNHWDRTLLGEAYKEALPGYEKGEMPAGAAMAEAGKRSPAEGTNVYRGAGHARRNRGGRTVRDAAVERDGISRVFGVGFQENRPRH